MRTYGGGMQGEEGAGGTGSGGRQKKSIKGLFTCKTGLIGVFVWLSHAPDLSCFLMSY